MRAFRWAAAPVVSCLAVTLLASRGLPQEAPDPDSVATARAEARENRARALAQEREAASGLVWDTSLREAFIRHLMGLPGEAFAQLSSAEPDAVVGALLGSATTDQVYTAVTPCRFVDSITAADRIATPANSTTARYYRVRGTTGSDFVSQGAASSAPSGCGIPTSATAVMVNLTVADPDADGDLRVDAAHVSSPSPTSVLNYTFGGARGRNLANAVVVPLCDFGLSACGSGATPTSPTRDMLVTFHAGAAPVSTYFIADVLGYFRPADPGVGCGAGTVFAELSAAQCPAGAAFGEPDCTKAALGTVCEFDTGCSPSQVFNNDLSATTSFNNGLNNCAGITDWYFRLR